MWTICPVDSVCLESALHSGRSLLLFHSEESAQREIDLSVEMKKHYKPYPVEVQLKPTQFKGEK